MRQIFLVFLTLVLAAALTLPGKAAGPQDYESLRLLTEAFYEISQKFVAKKGEEEMIYGSLRGLVNSLDPDSSFLTPKEYQEYLSGDKGPVAEAGLELIFKDQLLTVVSALDGGPAFRAGLRPGDHILKIDGKPVRNLTTQEAARRFQGKAGNSLKLHVFATAWSSLWTSRLSWRIWRQAASPPRWCKTLMPMSESGLLRMPPPRSWPRPLKISSVTCRLSKG